eukprot:CAMPEP_0194208674 /NCGR_PEP_ID=MMETSP0156-20130528/7063_1 /TAXON_ID=33649 /ORGANISM="Thalassionema nitzschioides, Strain L26-B" /LENGTH=441 /DNA_ID=CAMNT_0038935689 /DNA_START=103 /DNA_END=1428 /DNA_ORIENTATION=+
MVIVVTSSSTISLASRAFSRSRNVALAVGINASPQQRQIFQLRGLTFLQNFNIPVVRGSFSRNPKFITRCFSSSKRDFYEVLGVARGADKGGIKKAYFKLAKQHHPDTNKDDEGAAERFKEATEAYEVLSDDKQRQLYDQFGHAGVDPNSGFQQEGGNPFGGFGSQGFNFNDGSFHFSGSGGDQIDPDELFDHFFGGGRRRPRGPQRGADLQMHTNVSFKEAVFGASKDLHLRYQVRNPSTGQVEVKERDVTVKIPTGIDSGMNLRLGGQGAEGDPGAPKGDLLVQVIVDDDDYFIRNGYDVHTEIPISVTQALLGGTVDVETLSSNVEVKIPKGCQVDTKLMLRGKGIQKLNSKTTGNHVIHLKIEIPKSLSSRQEELLREFDEETKKSGNGLSGRLAGAVGSAFSNLFCNKEKSDDKDKTNSKEEGGDEDESVKKEAAQ